MKRNAYYMIQVLEEEQGITLITRGMEGVPQEGLSLPVLLLSQLGVGRSEYVHAQIHAGGGFRPKLLARQGLNCQEKAFSPDWQA